MRTRLVAAGLLSAALIVPATAMATPNRPRPNAHHGSAVLSTPGRSSTVGSVRLHPCAVVQGAECGHIDRPWVQGHPSAGTIRIGFAFRPATDHRQSAVGTLVPHEGGPGYATTSSGSSYAAMYGPLLARRNLLLVDQRGTGMSEPIDCPALQNLTIAYSVAARRCSSRLGSRRDDYTTPQSADDLAAVITALGLKRVDLYGDSYGTFFAQVFAGRHPDLLRSIVLDSAYPTYGETAWYPTQGPAMRTSFTKVCQRSPACRRAGSKFGAVIHQVLREVRRHPWRGVSHDADGRRMHVTVNAPNLAAVAFDATYGPYFYREFTAALRSGLRGDRAPLLRLVAQATGGSTNAGPVRDYSEGLDAAVSCHDYPQLYDMSAPPNVRMRQYRAALTRRTQRWPHTYGPFTVREYARSDWEELDWCTRWRPAPADNPARPPRPPLGYPSVPTLVLSGELDSITTPTEGAIVARQFPHARQILIANSFHVTADGDTDHCAVGILRRFVQTPDRLAAAPLRVEGAAGARDGPVPATPAQRHRRTGERHSDRAPHRSGRSRNRGRSARHMVEQLLGSRRRAARRPLELHRRPHHRLPPARRPAHVRPRGERDGDLATVCQPALGQRPRQRARPHGAAARRLGNPASRGNGDVARRPRRSPGGGPLPCAVTTATVRR